MYVCMYVYIYIYIYIQDFQPTARRPAVPGLPPESPERTGLELALCIVVCCTISVQASSGFLLRGPCNGVRGSSSIIATRKDRTCDVVSSKVLFGHGAACLVLCCADSCQRGVLVVAVHCPHPEPPKEGRFGAGHAPVPLPMAYGLWPMAHTHTHTNMLTDTDDADIDLL